MTVFNDLSIIDSLREFSAAAEIEEKESRKKRKIKRELAVWDIETDPFLYGRVPSPFCCGIAIKKPDCIEYHEFWGDDCIENFLMFICSYPTPLKIYAHNGGKFDFIYLLKLGWLEGTPRIINGRIVEAKLDQHILRDSYAIIPVALAQYQKTEIDYAKFEVGEREKHKREILDYLKDDCFFALELVVEFNDRFGDNITVGSLAIKKLQEFHPFERISQAVDENLRRFYFGGRVQCFEQGEIKGEFKVYDVNSMYPAVMRDCLHPVGGSHFMVGADNVEKYVCLRTGRAHNNNPFFIRFRGVNRGCLPFRDKDGSLNFTVEEGEFFAISHEIERGLKYGLIEIHEVIEYIGFHETITFDEYVDTYIKDKIEAKEAGDKARELFAKLLLNSAYGKTAQNPANYFDYIFVEPGEYDRIKRDNMEAVGDWQNETGFEFDKEVAFDHYPEVYGVEPPRIWQLKYDYDGICEVWQRPLEDHKYFDVAIGASITSAARGVLLDAIVSVKRPIYCDTDSIVCEAAESLDTHPTRLGAWDLEAVGDALHIYGKKVYALFDGEKLVKKACKGVQLSGDQIRRLCRGHTVTWENQAPTFRLDGSDIFVQRILGAEKHTKIFNEKGEKIVA